MAKGYCQKHYQRWKRSGDPHTDRRSSEHRATVPVVERFWEKVHFTMYCWEWTAFCTKDGYGKLNIGGYATGVHRYSYEQHHDTVLGSHEHIHHKCGNNKCVNPIHLQHVSARENTAEMSQRMFYEREIERLEERVLELEAEILRLKT